MLAFTEILTRNKQGNLVENQMEYLNILDRNGRRLNVLIGDLLDVSRVDAGTLILDHSDFDATELIDELARSFEPLLEMKSQTLEIKVDDGPLLVTADRERMAQVISNLLSNASKYTPDGGALGIGLWAEADELHFRIRDNGIGISEADQKQLFTSFFRADNEATRAVPGTGLGLVVVKGIVNQHGGDITVQSETGAGTTFSFHIHRAPIEPASEDSPDVTDDPADVADPIPNRQVRAA
jgi:signal transduction histidine kinase